MSWLRRKRADWSPPPEACELPVEESVRVMRRADGVFIIEERRDGSLMVDDGRHSWSPYRWVQTGIARTEASAIEHAEVLRNRIRTDRLLRDTPPVRVWP